MSTPNHRWLWAALLMISAPLPLRADSRLVFPRIVFQQGRFSGVAIANPTSSAATITLTAYNPDGTLFGGAGVVNPRTDTIPAGAQYSKLATEIFTPPSSIIDSPKPSRLWVEATSSVGGLTGFFLEGNNSIDFLDGADLVGTGTDLLLPLVENASGSTMEISVVNPGTASAQLSVDFLKKDGSLANTLTANIAARGALEDTLSNLFPQSYADLAAVRLRSNAPLSCYGFVLRETDNSMIIFGAQNYSAPARVLYFPQLAQGDDWSTTIGLVNVTNAQTLVTITAYQADGTVFVPPTITDNPVSKTIGPGGILRSDLKSLFGFAKSPLQSGWIKVEANDATLRGYVEYGAGGNRALVSAQTDSLSRMIFSHQATASPYYTGLAVLNTGGVASNITVVSLNKDGGVVGSAQRVLKPGQRESLLIQQWIPAAAGIVGGSIFIKSDIPVVTTQLFGTDSLSALANVPPQSLSTSFDPTASIPAIVVSPPLAVVETGKTQKFSFTGISNPSWIVNGVTGGNTTYGTISNTGSFTAPITTPEQHTLTIQAASSAGNQSGGATVDVIQREVLTAGLTLVTAVAYVSSLQRFFVAEQQVLSTNIARPGGIAATATNTKISEETASGASFTFLTFTNDTIGKMLPFDDSAGISYLLLAGSDSGKIYRANVKTRQIVTIASGLKSPSSLALDPVTGNLLVAESGANQLTLIPRAQFDPTASASTPTIFPRNALFDANSGRLGVAITSPQGVAFDSCTGSTFAVSSDGVLHQYAGGRERVIASGLDRPTEILVMHRKGLSSCLEGVSVLVCEATQISQVFPGTGQILTFVPGTQNALDLAFVPKGSAFGDGGEEQVSVAEGPPGDAASRVTRVGVGGILDSAPASPVPSIDPNGAPLPFNDPKGDTFATALSKTNGLQAIDLVSVDAYGVQNSLVMTLTFAGSVRPFADNAPNSISGFIDFDTKPGGSFASHADLYNPFNTGTGLLVDGWVDLSTGKVHIEGVVPDTPISMYFLDNTVTLRIPDILADATQSRIAIVVGNRLEMTDVAPYAGFIAFNVDVANNRTVQFAAATPGGLESVTSVPIQVTLSAAATQTVTVQYTALGGTAIGGGVDYSLPNGTLTFAPGETVKNIPLTIVNDTVAEPDETIRIFLLKPTNAALGAPFVYAYTIRDDDAIPTVDFVADASRGLESVTSPKIRVALSTATSKTVSVQYAVTTATATGGGVDYSLPPGTLTFLPGETVKGIPLKIIDDILPEGKETIDISLSSPVNATLGVQSAHVYTILDNDSAPSSTDVAFFLVGKSRQFFQSGPSTVALEGNQPFAFYVGVLPTPKGGILGGTLTLPGGQVKTVPLQSGFLDLSERFPSRNALDAAYPNGTYILTINTLHDGTKVLTINLTGDSYVPPTQAGNYTAAQAVDPTKDFTVTWLPFAGGSSTDFITFGVEQRNGPVILDSPFPFEPGALTGTATSGVIPANTLAKGSLYVIHVDYDRIIRQDSSNYPGAIGAAGYSTFFAFDLKTTGTLSANLNAGSNRTSSGLDGVSYLRGCFRKNSATSFFESFPTATANRQSTKLSLVRRTPTSLPSRKVSAVAAPTLLLPSTKGWFFTMWKRYAAAISKLSARKYWSPLPA